VTGGVRDDLIRSLSRDKEMVVELSEKFRELVTREIRFYSFVEQVKTRPLNRVSLLRCRFPERDREGDK